MKIGFYRLATALLVMTGGVGWGASWREINTGLPGAVVGVRSVTIDPVTPSTIYACSPSGFIFKSTDGGGSWKTISSLVGVSSLVVDPTNSTIYAVTSHGIVKSINGGESWIGANTGLANSPVYRLAIDPITPSTLYGLTPSGIVKSTNGGETWNAINTGFPSNGWFQYLWIDATATLYVAGGQGTFKSTDGGESWNVIFGGIFRVYSLVVDPNNSSTIYAAAILGTPRQGIIKSTDGGGSWNLIDSGLPPNAAPGNLAIDPITPSTIYVTYGGDTDQGIVKSTDGGSTWGVINTGLPSGDVGSLAIDPTAPSTIFAGYTGARNTGGLYKSTDGGASWNAAEAGLTTIDVRVLATDPVNTATVYTGVSTDGVFKSVDSGASWTKLSTFHIASVIPSPPGFFPNDDALIRSLLIDFVDPNVLYVDTARAGGGCSAFDKLVFKSTDGGVSWSADNSPLGLVCSGDVEYNPLPLVLDPTDRNTLYIERADVSRGDELLKSTDGGANWSNVWGETNGLQSSVRALAIDPTQPSTLYAGIELSFLGLGGVFKSTDGGANWSSAGLGDAAVTVLAIDPANPSTLYAETESQTVWYGAPQGFRGMFKSTDSGASWVPINNGLAGLFDTGSSVTAFLIYPRNSNTLYAGTSGSGVFRSIDSGANWSRFNDGLTNPDVRVLAIAPGNPSTLHAGTAGGVFAIAIVP